MTRNERLRLRAGVLSQRPSTFSPITMRISLPLRHSAMCANQVLRRAQAYAILPDAASRACGSGSVGRASPCQGEGRGSESRLPLQFLADDLLDRRRVFLCVTVGIIPGKP